MSTRTYSGASWGLLLMLAACASSAREEAEPKPIVETKIPEPVKAEPAASSAPDEAQAKLAVEAKLTGPMKLVSFKKTDGQPLEVGGAAAYRMWYEAEIEFTEKCFWYPDTFVANTGGGTRSQTQVPSGARRTVAKSIMFQRSENGWRLLR